MTEHTVRTALQHATTTLTHSPTPRLDAELLLCHTLQCSRASLMARLHDPLSTAQQQAFAAAVARRHTGESVAYITQQREFYGLDFFVDARVLVPRPETELLVECAISAAQRLNPGIILDIGSGSGCIGVALAVHTRVPQIVAVDISRDALAVSAINRDRHHLGARLQLVCADMCSPIRPVPLIVSNPPYVMDGAADADVARHEPALALYGGDADGIAFYRRLIALLPQHLSRPGFFAGEIDPRQADSIVSLLRETFPTGHISVLPDLAGHDRVVTLSLEE